MANPEKHRKNLLLEWLEGEESTLPAKPRSRHIVGSYIKVPKAVTRRPRRIVPETQPEKLEPALVREAAPPVKLQEKRTQANSPEHLRKASRIPKLRAPFTPHSRTSPGVRW
ncbi:MAG TPA: hypothetical protein PLA43_03545 [Bryobacteraceae bacterium]|nr:hypothetical protein [Bryobacteraceae bacterium]HOL71359.1 hypothetical protein [Bryobacteraceae bacterium]HOQ47640.1 hypothetical protein [Bryobacteraceae bacterium]HPQ14467.1 hypothetical protein [Bryobacteraceae bacterium]HPU71004.1 hypothetical protein [Bryobacteraceae bacterium]